MTVDSPIKPGAGDADPSLRLFEILTAARHIDVLERRYAARGQAHFHVSGFGHAASAALAPHLSPQDFLHLHYRDKALMLARGLTPLDFFLALFCKRGSHSNGRQMSAHMCSRPHNVLSIVGSVGNNALQAAGIAAAIKGNPDNPIVLCSFGDGTTQQGEVLEALAEASRSRLPVLFLVHDNQYAISTPTAGKTFFSRADGAIPTEFYGIPLYRLDGSQVSNCLTEFGPIVSAVRTTRSPAIVILEVERLDDHSNADDQAIYRSAEAIAAAQEKADPLLILRRQLLEIHPEARLAEIEARVHQQVEAAAEQALAAPDPEACTTAFIPADVEQESPALPDASKPRSMTMLEGLRETLRHRLSTDPRVVLHGQDIEDPKGDVFGLTRGLSSDFPHRVLNAPLSESTIVGSAIGRALAGQRPVALLQFADFLPLAFNQIASELATMDWRTNGQWKCPVIIMAICGGYKAGLGPFHAQTMEAFAAHIPGLDVFMPSNASDAAGLLEHAFQAERPTLFLYPKSCVNDRTLAREVVIGRAVAPGKATILRKGSDLTLVAWGATVPFCANAALELANYGAEVELIDLRSISPWDFDAVSQSVKKTNRLVIVHEDSLTAGFGAEIIARLSENGHHPAVRRVTRPDTYIPCNFENQLEILPTTDRIVAEAAALLGITLSRGTEEADAEDPYLYTVNAFGLSPSDDQIGIIQWHVSPGDTVKAGDILADVEADKSSGELDSPVSGIVHRLVQAEGSSVAVGSPLLIIRTPEQVQHQHRTHPPLPAVIGHPQRTQEPAVSQGRKDSATGGIIVGPIVVVTGQSALTNEELAERFDTTPDEIFRKIGIESRPRVPPSTSPADLAWKAVAPLLDSPDFNPAAISLVIASTSTVAQVCPSVACHVLGQLQRHRPEVKAPAFDILATCTGWLYALQLAHDHLQQPQARRGTALVITTEMLSPLIAPEDFGSCISFGDASTATVIYGPEADHAPAPGVAPIAMRRPVISAMGDLNHELTVPPMGTGSTIHMDGRAVRQHTVPAMARALRQALSEADLVPADLALLLAHQSNHRILTDLAAALGLPAEALPSNLRNLGNTSSCTLPLLLNDQRAHNALTAGTDIGFTAFGGGYTYGAAIGRVL